MSKRAPWLADVATDKGTKSKGPAGRRAPAKKTAKKKPTPATKKRPPGVPADIPLPPRQAQRYTNARQEATQAANVYQTLSLEQLETGLAPSVVDRYRRFVHEYVKDYHKGKAYQRSSEDREELDTKTLNKRALIVFWHPYTQLYLATIREELKKKAVFTGEDILQRLWEEANSTERDASAGTRLGALTALAKATGIDKPATAAGKQKGHSSGVMVVPGWDFDSWCSACETSQAALKTEAVNADAA